MKSIHTNEMTVMPSSMFSGKHYWAVYNKKTCALLKSDYTNSMEHALRAARNFIRHNQNAVYG